MAWQTLSSPVSSCECDALDPAQFDACSRFWSEQAHPTSALLTRSKYLRSLRFCAVAVEAFPLYPQAASAFYTHNGLDPRNQPPTLRSGARTRPSPAIRVGSRAANPSPQSAGTKALPAPAAIIPSKPPLELPQRIPRLPSHPLKRRNSPHLKRPSRPRSRAQAAVARAPPQVGARWLPCTFISSSNE